MTLDCDKQESSPNAGQERQGEVMSEIDRAQWEPVASWKIDAFLLGVAVFDVAVIVLGIWYLKSKGWL